MENIELKIEKVEGNSFLTILEGKAKEPWKPLKVGVAGSITVPSEFWAKRKGDYQQCLNQCHLLIDKENYKYSLVVKEEDPEYSKTLTGTLKEHPDFVKFGINSERTWTPAELSNFFRMNRYYFLDKDDNMKLVKDLNNYNGKITAEFEKENNKRGNVTENRKQVLNSNIPEDIVLDIPFFIGQEPQRIKVEFELELKGMNDIVIRLVSPEAKESMQYFRDNVFKEEIEKFENQIAVFIIS